MLPEGETAVVSTAMRPVPVRIDARASSPQRVPTPRRIVPSASEASLAPRATAATTSAAPMMTICAPRPIRTVSPSGHATPRKRVVVEAFVPDQVATCQSMARKSQTWQAPVAAHAASESVEQIFDSLGSSFSRFGYGVDQGSAGDPEWRRPGAVTPSFVGRDTLSLSADAL